MGKVKKAKVVVEDGPPPDAEVVSEPAIVFPAVPSASEVSSALPPAIVSDKPVATMQHTFMAKCNTCFLKDSCAVYKPDSDCNLGIKVEINDAKDVVSFTKQMMRIAGERVMRAYHFELANGGVVSPEVKDAMEQFMELTRLLKELGDNRDTVEIRAKGQGIISQIFGGMMKKGR